MYLEYYLGRVQVPVFDEYENQVYYESGKMKGKPKFQIKHNRRKENLPLYLFDKPKTPIEKEQNKSTLELANRIRYEKEQEFNENKTGYRIKSNKKTDFINFMQNYYDSYTKKDKRMIKMAINRFEDFILIEYPQYNKFILADQIDRDMIIKFVEYLHSKSTGEGAATAYKRFKKIIKYAVDHDFMKKNPCHEVVCKTDEDALVKDILSLGEIEKEL